MFFCFFIFLEAFDCVAYGETSQGFTDATGNIACMLVIISDEVWSGKEVERHKGKQCKKQLAFVFRAAEEFFTQLTS